MDIITLLTKIYETLNQLILEHDDLETFEFYQSIQYMLDADSFNYNDSYMLSILESIIFIFIGYNVDYKLVDEIRNYITTNKLSH